MKGILILLMVLSFTSLKAQILLRNNQGEELFAYKGNYEGTLINLNTANASLGLDYFTRTKAKNPSDYSIFRLGVSSRATDGVSALLKQGQLSPGFNINGTYTKVGLLTAGKINGKYDDWLEIRSGYATDKYKIFKSDTTFKEQITSPRFESFNLGLSYNFVLGQYEQDYFSFGFSVTRKSNYNDLSSIEITDYKTSTDQLATTERKYGNNQTAKQGPLKTFDAYPLSITYTHLPKFQRTYLLNKDNQDSTIEKKNTIKQIVYTPSRRDTITHITKNSAGKEVKKHEIILTNAKTDTITIITTEKIKQSNPFYKSLKTGYAVYFNGDFNNSENPSQSHLGATIFLLSPNKDNILTSRLGINAEIRDFFDVKKANNGVLKRINIGLTVNFVL